MKRWLSGSPPRREASIKDEHMTHGFAFPWKEWETRLRELQLQSPEASAQALACVLSSEAKIYVNKNMVIGKLHRMGLWPSRESAKWQNVVRPPAPVDSATKRLKGKQTVKTTRLPGRLAAVNGSFYAASSGPLEIPPEPETPSELIPIGQRCAILDLTPTTCRWIVGDSRKPLEKIYCGADGADFPLQPYCMYHADRAVNKPRVRAEAA
jgi:GcrA cell cycle regulator